MGQIGTAFFTADSPGRSQTWQWRRGNARCRDHQRMRAGCTLGCVHETQQGFSTEKQGDKLETTLMDAVSRVKHLCFTCVHDNRLVELLDTTLVFTINKQLKERSNKSDVIPTEHICKKCLH